MNLRLIQGEFSPTDAIDILTQLVKVKIKFHENKINSTYTEEDIKMAENRIKQLQQQLHESRIYIEQQGKNIAIESELIFN